MHKPYEIISGHPADFRVSYRFLDAEEGGRQNPPYQGYRSDLWYDDPYWPKPDPPKIQVFMIWPEFEDTNGNVILDNSKPVAKSGYARMWIANPEMRGWHIKGIYVGQVGYFMEGHLRVAECTVIEILGLLTNPTSR